MTKTRAYTTGLRTILKIAAKLLKTRNWLMPIWRDSTQIVYAVGQIIKVEHSKKIWKLHKKMPKTHSGIQPGIRSRTCMPDRLPDAQISYLRKMTIDTSKRLWAMHQLIRMGRDLCTIALYEPRYLPMQLDKI